MPEQPPREPLDWPREPPDWPRKPLLPYNGLALDRAAGRRADDAWLRGVARRQQATDRRGSYNPGLSFPAAA
jgi:hypothetical protein